MQLLKLCDMVNSSPNNCKRSAEVQIWPMGYRLHASRSVEMIFSLVFLPAFSFLHFMEKSPSFGPSGCHCSRKQPAPKCDSFEDCLRTFFTSQDRQPRNESKQNANKHSMFNPSKVQKVLISIIVPPL